MSSFKLYIHCQKKNKKNKTNNLDDKKKITQKSKKCSQPIIIHTEKKNDARRKC